MKCSMVSIQPGLIAGLYLFVFLFSSWGADTYIFWSGSAGNWSDDAKWNGGHEPTLGDYALVKGGEALIDSVGEVARQLTLAESGTGSLRMTNGTLTTTFNLQIGDVGDGVMHQSGGTVTVGDQLLMAYNTIGGSAEYNLSGGVLQTEQTIVGNKSVAVFNHSGGLHAPQIELNVGKEGDGTYNLSDNGRLEAPGEYIGFGYTSTSTFNQTGGTNVIAGILGAGPYGLYHLTDGLLQIGGSVSGGGLTLDGGVMTAGGSVDPSRLRVGDAAGTSGAFVWTDMAANPGALQIGYSGAGTFTQVSGSINASDLDVAYNAGSQGMVTLQDNANLHTLNQNVGRAGIGTVVQTGGTNTMTYDMKIGTIAGGEGTYTLAGGRLTGGRDLDIGIRGAGSFLASGGEMAFNDIQIGGFAGSSGLMEISGTAAMGANYLTVGYDNTAASILNQAAGEIVVTNRTRVVSGQYNLTGGMLEMVRGTSSLEIGNYGSGATLWLGNSTGTGAISEQGAGDGVDLKIDSSGKGILHGWGTVDLSGTLDNSGRVVADGYGTSRDLNLTSFGNVANLRDNTGANGWYAVNKGRLLLPPITIEPGFNKTYNWGEDPADTTIDMVNSVRMSYAQVLAGGTVSISLLAPDHDLIPDLSGTGPDMTLIAGFDFEESGTLTFTTVDLTLKYDAAAVLATGLSALSIDDLMIYKTVVVPFFGEQWVNVMEIPGANVTVDVDTNEHTIAINGVPGYSSFAVGVVPDIDSDGLPNDWETLYFGGPTNANPDATCSNGIDTVRDSYVAGFDPADPDAFFEVSDFTPLSSENILQWLDVSGRVYSVYWSSNLVNGFETMPLASNITSGVFTDTVHSAEDSIFYRLDVDMAP